MGSALLLGHLCSIYYYNLINMSTSFDVIVRCDPEISYNIVSYKTGIDV